MALHDYVICGECETKIIYDGYYNGRDRLEEVWGDPNADIWTVHLLCPDCIKKMRADLAATRDELRDLEIELTRARKQRDTLAALLQELTALVQGECPSLLSEDSGGDARLSLDIDAALAAQREGRTWIKVGYGASHEDVAECRDLCSRIDAELKDKS